MMVFYFLISSYIKVLDTVEVMQQRLGLSFRRKGELVNIFDTWFLPKSERTYCLYQINSKANKFEEGMSFYLSLYACPLTYFYCVLQQKHFFCFWLKDVGTFSVDEPFCTVKEAKITVFTRTFGIQHKETQIPHEKDDSHLSSVCSILTALKILQLKAMMVRVWDASQTSWLYSQGYCNICVVLCRDNEMVGKGSQIWGMTSLQLIVKLGNGVM